MRRFVVVDWVRCCVVSLLLLRAEGYLTPEYVDRVNGRLKGGSWTAGLSARVSGMSRAEVSRLLGVSQERVLHGAGDRSAPLKTFTQSQRDAAPPSFDSRKQWPQCRTISEIVDQSDCGDCWATGAVTAMSDRHCIATGRSVKLSIEDMNSCGSLGQVKSCGGCQGGDPSCAWMYWTNFGVVSDACSPFSLPPCDHDPHPGSSSPYPPCPEKTYPTPPCPKACVAGSGLNWTVEKAAHKGSRWYRVSGERDMMTEISTNGPCEGQFMVYEDWPTYRNGVYAHSNESALLGGHAVRILGYGVDDASGLKYWTVANSWNTYWGEEGTFRILRGTNEAWLEHEMYCGTPATA